MQLRVAPARRRDNSQPVAEATLGFALGQARYRLGLSSIVELSQAQFQQTSTDIRGTNARDPYRMALATLNYAEGVNPRLTVLSCFAHENTSARNNSRGLCHFTIESAFHKGVCRSAKCAVTLA